MTKFNYLFIVVLLNIKLVLPVEVASRSILSDLVDTIDVLDVLEEDNVVDVIDTLDVLDVLDEELIEDTVHTLDVLDILDDEATDILNTTELAAYFGYDSKEHTVVTEDGYILSIFQVFNQNCTSYIDTPVLLMHGLIQNSDNWLVAGPGTALTFLLADACFSVWLGNQRGNYYGQRHLSLDCEEDDEFWEFTYDEMGVYDTPAMIDYILNDTGADGLNFIGYSQSGATFIAMCSMRPEYCEGEKIKLILALAPAAFMGNITSPLKILIEAVGLNEELFLSLDLNRIFVRGTLVQDIISAFCTNTFIIFDEVCSALLEFVDMMTVNSVSSNTLDIMFNYIPDGASMANWVKYVQSHYNTFKWYDYNDEEKNIARYGSSSPPEYKFENVKVPVVVMRGLNDHIVDRADVLHFSKKLPNLVELIDVDDDEWNHFDFAFSDKVPNLTYPYIYHYLTLYS